MANYLATDTDLASVSSKIREKTGTSTTLEFPAEFNSEIDKLSAYAEKKSVRFYWWSNDESKVRFLYDGNDLKGYSILGINAMQGPFKSNGSPFGNVVGGLKYIFLSMNQSGTLLMLTMQYSTTIATNPEVHFVNTSYVDAQLVCKKNPNPNEQNIMTLPTDYPV